jgi:hypothetical protein
MARNAQIAVAKDAVQLLPASAVAGAAPDGGNVNSTPPSVTDNCPPISATRRRTEA